MSNQTVSNSYLSSNPDFKVASTQLPDSSQIQHVVVVGTNNTPVNGIGLPTYDYLSVTYPTATTEQYQFYSGGSGGTLVATIQIVYTDSTKEFITSVTKT